MESDEKWKLILYVPVKIFSLSTVSNLEKWKWCGECDVTLCESY